MRNDERLPKIESLKELWDAGYTTRRLSVSGSAIDRRPSFEIAAPDRRILGYAQTTAKVIEIVNRDMGIGR